MAAYSGDFDKAHDEYAEAQRFATQFANPVVGAFLTLILGIIELLEDDPSAAELALRDGYDRLTELGAEGLRASIATLLADSVSRQGRDEEATELLDVADGIAQTDDFDPQVRSRSVPPRSSPGEGSSPRPNVSPARRSRSLPQPMQSCSMERRWSLALKSSMLWAHSRTLRLHYARRSNCSSGRRTSFRLGRLERSSPPQRPGRPDASTSAANPRVMSDRGRGACV